ncbi:N-acetylmuramoyl-L-alanine amidase [Cupriavidus sp. KB_39]|uniref:peptidoglycan recognition protein family protein n=1 Tax=Cupriavidus sp. KB_39 TaxID=3233036 RepID=UPI003F90336F
MLFIDKNGIVDAERIKIKRFPGIERGLMAQVNGIVVHQTDAATAQSTFNSYGDKGAHGAHLLIDKDGTIYQTASLLRVTNHVGRLKSRCIATCNCSPTELRLAMAVEHNTSQLSRHEHKKPWPERYPSNYDSIGIEIVGKSYEVPQKPGKPKEEPVYESVTGQQNAALQWLISELTDTLSIASNAVFRHPLLSKKNKTEASTARW